MRKMASVLLVCAMALGTLAGCGSNNATTEATNEGGSDSVTITHTKGEAVISAAVKKAVVFDFGTLDNMDALGVEVEIAAPTGNLPSYLSKYSDAISAGDIKEPDLEAIYAFAPDVIFISGRQADLYEELNKIAPTIYVEVEAATYMEDFEKNLNMVATVFGKTDVVEEKLAFVNDKVVEAKAVAEKSEAKALIILTNDGSVSAYGAGSRFGIIHDVLGINQADEDIEVSTHGQEVTFEYISKVNPDILFVVDRTTVAGGSNTADKTLDNDLVKETNAAQNDKIVSLNPDTWYLSGGGVNSIISMIDEVLAAIQ